MLGERLTAEIDFSWRPFTVDGDHLLFAEHVMARLEVKRCSYWGPAVYKWQGLLKAGPHSGKVGVLVGETSDLRQRIKQYVSGTQERGNRLWRETPRKLGDIIPIYTILFSEFNCSGQKLGK